MAIPGTIAFGIAGVGVAALIILHPLWVRYRKARLEAVRAGAPQRYFEELRELEAYATNDKDRITVATVGTGIGVGIFIALFPVAMHYLSNEQMGLLNLALALCTCVAAVVGGIRAWHKSRPDPRGLAISPAPGDTSERARRNKWLVQFGGSVLLAIASVMLAIAAAPRALEKLW